MRVQDVGPIDADVMLIGEAPGETEERKGTPFRGRAGDMLKQMLSHAGIDYNRCYVTNIMDTRPPGNSFKYFYSGRQPTKQLEDAWQRLRDKVEAIKPKVVIPLGKEPLKALCNKNSIGDWRGTWLSFRGINVLPTYHPSYILRVYGEHPIVELDLKKAVSQKPAEEPEIILQPSIGTALSWLADNARTRDTSAAICNRGRVSFDIETIGKHTRCIAIATKNLDKHIHAICIPFIKFASSDMAKPVTGSSIVKMQSSSGLAGSYWTANEEVAVLDSIDKLFRSGIQVVGQNSISFDAPLIRQEFGLTIENHYLDTMHAWHVLYPELPKSLSFLCSVLTNYRNYWTEKDTNNDMQEWKYNAMDATVTLEASYPIEKELKEIEV